MKKINVKLGKVEPRPPLVWDTILAKVAEAKALDMARHNYFADVDKQGGGINILIHEAGYYIPEDYYSDPKSNYFESLDAGPKTAKTQSII